MEIEDRKQLEQRIAELERQLKNERQKQQWALEGEDSGVWIGGILISCMK